MKCVEITLKLLGLEGKNNMETELSFPESITEDQAVTILKAFVDPDEPIKEVCEWEEIETGYMRAKYKLGCTKKTYLHNREYNRDPVYCPYCGKPISIKGE